MSVIENKLCKRCKAYKKISLFTRDSRAKDSLSTYCKECHNEKNRLLYAKQGDFARLKYSNSKQRLRQTAKGKYTEYTNAVKSKYASGLTVKEFDELLQQMLLEQQGCCKDCRIDFAELPTQYHIDHDHDTGLIRDLVCNACNQKRKQEDNHRKSRKQDRELPEAAS